jgi:hypothetical protein
MRLVPVICLWFKNSSTKVNNKNGITSSSPLYLEGRLSFFSGLNDRAGFTHLHQASGMQASKKDRWARGFSGWNSMQEVFVV